MNTRMDVILWGQPEHVLQEAYGAIRELLIGLEKVLSRFDPQAETYRLNQLGAHQPMVVSDLLWTVLKDSVEYNQRTLGYFDVCYLGKIGTGGWLENRILFDEQDHRVSFAHPSVQLDFGAIGKGIALEQVQTILKKYEIENSLISFGESSILARGKHPHGNCWPFAFQARSGISETIQLTNSCLSISGLHGESTHIVNPSTGEISDNLHSVCVWSSCPVEAEVLSTALVAAPMKEHQSVMKNFETLGTYFSNQ